MPNIASSVGHAPWGADDPCAIGNRLHSVSGPALFFPLDLSPGLDPRLVFGGRCNGPGLLVLPAFTIPLVVSAFGLAPSLLHRGGGLGHFGPGTVCRPVFL